MKNYIGGPIQINTMFLLLKKETQNGSKSVYPDFMESRVHFHLNPITQFGEFITQYKAFHLNVTENLQVELVEMEFTQTQAKLIFCYSLSNWLYPFCPIWVLAYCDILL